MDQSAHDGHNHNSSSNGPKGLNCQEQADMFQDPFLDLVSGGKFDHDAQGDEADRLQAEWLQSLPVGLFSHRSEPGLPPSQHHQQQLQGPRAWACWWNPQPVKDWWQRQQSEREDALILEQLHNGADRDDEADSDAGDQEMYTDDFYNVNTDDEEEDGDADAPDVPASTRNPAEGSCCRRASTRRRADNIVRKLRWLQSRSRPSTDRMNSLNAAAASSEERVLTARVLELLTQRARRRRLRRTRSRQMAENSSQHPQFPQNAPRMRYRRLGGLVPTSLAPDFPDFSTLCFPRVFLRVLLLRPGFAPDSLCLACLSSSLSPSTPSRRPGGIQGHPVAPAAQAVDAASFACLCRRLAGS